MTVSQFKSYEQNRSELAAILSNQTFVAACAALLNESHRKSSIKDDAPEIASVRALSRRQGYEEFLTELQELIHPEGSINRSQDPDWGAEEAMKKLQELTRQ